MLNTVLFDMGGTLEDVWNNQETQANVMKKLQEMLRAHGLEPGCDDEEFEKTVLAGLKAYKSWCAVGDRELKPEEIWPDYYLKAFHFDREKLIPITEELANMWEVTYFHRELRPGVKEMLDGLRERGYHIGVISNNASLYNVFNMLDEYGIREYMEDVTVSSITGYRKPHGEIFRISLRQMQKKAEECVYVGDTVSRDIIGPKRAGFGAAVQIAGSHLAAERDANLGADAEKPDVIITDIRELLTYLDEVNPEMAVK
ncbi:MAG: HAD family hydrolase [Oscillibacter sp.]|nr:HAD family hydrolase [Oscillibacter sp.]